MAEDAGVCLTPWLATSLAPIAAAVTIQAHWLGWVTRRAVGPLGPQLLCRRGAVCIQRAWRSCKLHLSTCALFLFRTTCHSQVKLQQMRTLRIHGLLFHMIKQHNIIIYCFPANELFSFMLSAIVFLNFQTNAEGCFSPKASGATWLTLPA